MKISPKLKHLRRKKTCFFRTISTLTMIILVINAHNTFAQKTIKLNEELATNSATLKVKVKGSTGMFSYAFGEYKTIDSKNKKSKEKEYKNISLENYLVSGLAKDYQRIWEGMERKESFVFVGHKMDTTIVNMGFSYDSFSNVPLESRKDNSDERTLSKNTREKFVAFLKPISISKSKIWTLEIDTYTGKYVKADGKIKSEGTLSDSYRVIKIVPIKQWSNGKTSDKYPILGFEFLLKEQRIATVQSSRNIMHKKVVWLQNGLSKNLEIAVATASVCLMSMVDDQAQRN